MKKSREVEIKVTYSLEEEEESVFISFLKGEISSRKVGEKLGKSHQQALNLIGSLCRQWIKEGKLVFRNGQAATGLGL